ncbi:cytochrome P450 [Lactarius sanguifluus]|nr:cytochrome P450 [Lactarius sanguifluus]
MLALVLMKNPPSLKQFQRHTWSSLLSINYDHPPVESEDDPVVASVAGHILRIMHEVHPGMRLVEFFPWMKYIPSCFAKWKCDAQHWVIQDSLRNEHLLSEVADDLVQVRAHAELDQVIGRDRPPTFADLPSLPYTIRAMTKEVLRWSPPLPFGIPHASSTNDWYEGMLIPKGTVVLPNMRLINSDPAVYGADSARFNPSRYLDEKYQCPGRFAAEETLAIDFATLLWALHFERPEGVKGELDVHTFVRIGVGARPKPFECNAPRLY